MDANEDLSASVPLTAEQVQEAKLELRAHYIEHLMAPPFAENTLLGDKTIVSTLLQLSATRVSISMQDQVPSWLEQFSNIFSPQLTDLEDYAEVKTYIGIVWLKKHNLNNFHRKSLLPWMLKLNSCMLHCDQKLLSMDFDIEWQQENTKTFGLYLLFTGH